MILWLTGNSQSGKTTLARRLARGQKNTIILDGDRLRQIWPGLGLSKEDRWEQNLRAARLAKELDEQGLCVIVAVIAPYEDLRREIDTICGCNFIHIDHNKFPDDASRPFEPPSNPVITVQHG